MYKGCKVIKGRITFSRHLGLVPCTCMSRDVSPGRRASPSFTAFPEAFTRPNRERSMANTAILGSIILLSRTYYRRGFTCQRPSFHSRRGRSVRATRHKANNNNNRRGCGTVLTKATKHNRPKSANIPTMKPIRILGGATHQAVPKKMMRSRCTRTLAHG
ncbi:hypothetical protein BCR34DRAFT_124718 [Clohesyomyces aquaticus]|uniref:Uncharacterized protein n=1 Tax=Clohesyomyces aquaticus TaxID=1231657 RepID=A0A1Y1YNK1_9PLEO|nr:hypothetical protein BCR34DRAFT_124718 [Clohesyomyces aquaticus]